jgi:large subunit ribosomal protein L29
VSGLARTEATLERGGRPRSGRWKGKTPSGFSPPRINMKYSELTTKSPEILRKELIKLQEKRENLRMKVKLGQVKNTNELSRVRKDIARILTFLRAN